MRLIVLRHAPTAWNAQGRLQGRADPPLDRAGELEAAQWRLPDGWRELPCRVSPLRRAVQTAAILGFDEPVVVPALVEMDWGEFEGRRLAELRAELGASLAANEAQGLDFRPPGGETPREVMARLRRWLGQIEGADDAAVAITHKGVRRALVALATGWDMQTKPPIRAGDDAALVFELGPQGHLDLTGSVALRPGP